MYIFFYFLKEIAMRSIKEFAVCNIKRLPSLCSIVRLKGVHTFCIMAALAGAACSTTTPQAQYAHVHGFVLKPNGEPVTGAVVSTIPATKSYQTLEDGSYRLNNIGLPGEYVVVAKHPEIKQEGRHTVQVQWGLNDSVTVVLGGTQGVDLINKPGTASPPVGSPGKRATGQE